MAIPSKVNIQEDVDFEIGVMNFNKYEVDDGTILRFLSIPTKILRTDQIDQMGNPLYMIQHRNIVDAIVQKNERGEFDGTPFDINEDELEPIDFIAIREPWNTYKLADGTNLRFRSIVSQVLKSIDKFNQYGEPIYQVYSDQSADFRVPKHLNRRRRRKKKK